MVQVNETERKEIIDRLRTVQGHLSGIEKMVAEGRECEDIMHQLLAIRAAVDKMTVKVAEHYVLSCHLNAVDQGKNPEENFRKAIQLIMKLNK
ncbi:MAG: metal-sensitive transcriptional regulator [Firmicutes bacterium]|nr:metal-sensitive transcriptional regulator [Bacillota bacterium]